MKNYQNPITFTIPYNGFSTQNTAQSNTFNFDKLSKPGGRMRSADVLEEKIANDPIVRHTTPQEIQEAFIALCEHMSYSPIIMPIGEGGEAIVYRATDSSDTDYAVKIGKTTYHLRCGYLSRMIQAGVIMESLQNYNYFPRIINYGMIPLNENNSFGVPYTVMEYVYGGTLTQRLAEGKLTLSEALPILLDTAVALELLQKEGGHGDFKPDNILFHNSGKVLVADVTPRLAGKSVFTPGYAAPEIHAYHLGQKHDNPCQAAADVFAWAATAYVTLTGHEPYDGMQMLKGDLMSRIQWNNIPIPQTLKDTLFGALNQDPKKRPSIRTILDTLYFIQRGAS